MSELILPPVLNLVTVMEDPRPYSSSSAVKPGSKGFITGYTTERGNETYTALITFFRFGNTGRGRITPVPFNRVPYKSKVLSASTPFLVSPDTAIEIRLAWMCAAAMAVMSDLNNTNAKQVMAFAFDGNNSLSIAKNIGGAYDNNAEETVARYGTKTFFNKFVAELRRAQAMAAAATRFMESTHRKDQALITVFNELSKE